MATSRASSPRMWATSSALRPNPNPNPNPNPKPNPNWKAVRVKYDRTVCGFETLMDIFEKSHIQRPSYASSKYASCVFARNAAQRKAIASPASET